MGFENHESPFSPLSRKTLYAVRNEMQLELARRYAEGSEEKLMEWIQRYGEPFSKIAGTGEKPDADLIGQYRQNPEGTLFFIAERLYPKE